MLRAERVRVSVALHTDKARSDFSWRRRRLLKSAELAEGGQQWTDDDSWAVEEEIDRHERWAKEWRSAGRTEEGRRRGAPEQVSLVGVTDDEAVALILSARHAGHGPGAGQKRHRTARERQRNQRRRKFGQRSDRDWRRRGDQG